MRVESGGNRHLANVLFLVCQLQIVSQKRSRAYSKPPNDLVHIWAKRSSSGGNSFMDFRRNKFNFLVTLKYKLRSNGRFVVVSMLTAWLRSGVAEH